VFSQVLQYRNQEKHMKSGILLKQVPPKQSLAHDCSILFYLLGVATICYNHWLKMVEMSVEILWRFCFAPKLDSFHPHDCVSDNVCSATKTARFESGYTMLPPENKHKSSTGALGAVFSYSKKSLRVQSWFFQVRLPAIQHLWIESYHKPATICLLCVDI